MTENYVDGSVGRIVRMIVRMVVSGGCLPVRGTTRMSWKHDGEQCVCSDVESEKHVFIFYFFGKEDLLKSTILYT